MASEFLTNTADATLQQSFFDKTGQFLTHGLADSAVSAFASFYNTGVALGNVFGLDAQKLDTQEAINNTLGSDYANYYSQHKDLVDATGLALGSFLPGLGAIKLGRAVAMGALGGRVSTLATAIREVMIPASRVQAAETAVQSANFVGNMKNTFMALAAKNYGQQAIEAALYETGTLLTMNQSSALSRENLGYFQAIGANLDSAAFGVVFGGAIGGTLGAFTDSGKLKAFIHSNRQNIVGSGRTFDAGVNAIVGDKAILRMDDMMQLKDRLQYLQTNPDYMPVTNLAEQNLIQQTLQNSKTELVGLLNRNSVGGRLGTHLFNALEKNGVPDSVRQDTLIGMRKLRPLQDKEVSGRIAANVAPDSAFPDNPSLFTKKYPDYNIDTVDGMNRLLDHISTEANNGKDVGQIFHEAIGYMQPENIAALMRGNRTLKVKLRGPDGKILKDGTGTAITSPMKLNDAMRSFLNDFDPSYADLYKQYDLAMADATTDLVKGQALDRLLELETTNKMFSSVYRIFNQADLSPDLMKQITGFNSPHKALYEWMNNNKLLQYRFGGTTAYADLTTGEATNLLPVAHVADMGDVNVSGKSVRVARKIYKIEPLSIDNQTPTHATALYTAATSKFGYKNLFNNSGHLSKAAKNVSLTDIPSLEAIFNKYNIDSLGSITLKGLDGKPVRFTNQAELGAAISDAKKNLILHLSTDPKYKFDENQIAAFAGTDANYVHAVLSGHNNPASLGSEFLTRDKLYSVDQNGIESFAPHHCAIEYDAHAFNDQGIRSTSVSDVIKRIQAIQDYNDITFNSVMGEHSDLFPSIQQTRNGSATFADGATGVDQGPTLLRSTNGGYMTTESINQTIGSSLAKMESDFSKHLAEVSAGHAKAVASDPNAIAELSVLRQAVLRQGKYQWLPHPATMTSPDFQQISSMLGIDLTDTFNNSVLKASGITDVNSALIDQELLGKFQEVMSRFTGTTSMSAEDFAKLKMAAEVSKDPQLVLKLQQATKNLQTEIQGNILGASQAMQEAITNMPTKQLHAIQNKTAADALHFLHDTTKQYTSSRLNLLYDAEGANTTINPDIIYPGVLQPSKFKHIAFVRVKNAMYDPWAAKDRGMIIAHNAEALNQKIAHFRKFHSPDDVEILTNQQSKEWLIAKKEYDAQAAVTDLSVDSSLRNDKKLWDLMPEPNPNEFQDALDSIRNQYANINRRAVKLKYAQEIKTYEQLDKAWSPSGDINKSVATTSPWKKQINLMLNIRNADHTWWDTIQETADKAVANQAYALKGAMFQAQTSGDWQHFDNTLGNYGLPQVYKEAKDWIISNSTAPRPLLQSLVSKTNGVFATLMLRMDQCQAIVNAMATPVMLVPEIKALVHTLGNMSEEDLKRFNLLTSTPLNATGDRLPGNTKLIWQAARNRIQSDGKWFKLYQRHGILSSIQEDVANMIDTAAFPASKDINAWKKGLDKVVQILSTPTDFSEQTVKFMAADVARQVLTAAKVPEDNPLFWSTIRTFVNNVHGNYNVAQRPGLFHGWFGQAIGLFQTYQFNMFNRFMRHIEEGNGAAKYMIGMQTSIFGTQSLPGFQILNNHIADRTNGQKDFYTLAGNSFDNPVAEFLLYGGGSSLTRPLLNGKGIDFYSRGDLTPRTPILIPTSFSEIPAISFASKVYTDVANVISGIANGGDAKTIVLNALASNGVYRPLAGAAQLWQGYRTTAQGNTIVAYPNIDWATRVTKLMGSKTLDEAIAVSAYYRALGYRARQMDKLDQLGAVFKSKLRQDGGITSEDMTSVMQKYVEAGGRIESFKRWTMSQYAGAATSNVNKLRDNLKSNSGIYLQHIMGASLPDIQLGNPL